MSRTQLIGLIRKLEEYEAWKKAVFLRDRFTCQQCGARNGRHRVIEADHIKPLSQVVKEQGVDSIESALSCSLLWDIASGRTLCRTCHELTESYPVQLRRKGGLVKKGAGGAFSSLPFLLMLGFIGGYQLALSFLGDWELIGSSIGAVLMAAVWVIERRRGDKSDNEDA